MSRTTDWEMLDGMPRWVWEADEMFSRMPRVVSPADLRERTREVTVRVERLRRQYMPQLSARAFQDWIGPRLEECRRRRNIVLHPMDGRPVRLS